MNAIHASIWLHGAPKIKQTKVGLTNTHIRTQTTQEIVLHVVHRSLLSLRDLEFECIHLQGIFGGRGGTCCHRLIAISYNDGVSTCRKKIEGDEKRFNLKGNYCILAYLPSIQPKNFIPKVCGVFI